MLEPNKVAEAEAEGAPASKKGVVVEPVEEVVAVREERVEEADHIDPEEFIKNMKEKVKIIKVIEENGKSKKIITYLVPKIEELEKLITFAKNKKDTTQYDFIKNTFNFMNEAKIESICDLIEDKTEINFEKVDKGEINLFDELRDKKFGEGDFTHIPSKLNEKEGGKFHIPKIGDVGEVSPEAKNSPPNVVYMANLFTYFFTKVIDNPNGNNKLFAVGGIFPSFLLNKELKDFDFALVSEIENFPFYMRYLIIYFMVFVFIAKERKGKFNAVEKINGDNEIKFKEDSKPNIEKPNYYENQTHNNYDKPLNFNVKIGDKNNGFEGLDLVLLRKTDGNGKETDLHKPYGENEDKERNLKINMIQDARRRETYLNVMYASMEVKDGGVSENKTQLMVSDYFAENIDFKNKYIAAFSKWEHLPTNGITTFTVPFTSSYRVGRIMKMYLKKWFKPDGSLVVLSKNKQQLITLRKKHKIDLLEDQSNSLENNFFKLLSKNNEIGLINEEVKKNIAKIFYEMDFYFLYEEKEEKEKDEYKAVFETHIKNMIDSYLDPSINSKYDNKYFILCLAYAYFKEEKEEKEFVTHFKNFLILMAEKNLQNEIFISSGLKELFNYGRKNTSKKGGNTYLKYLYCLELAKTVNYLLKLNQNDAINNKIDEFITNINSKIEEYLTNIDKRKKEYLEKEIQKKINQNSKSKSGGGKNKNKKPQTTETYLRGVSRMFLTQQISLNDNLNEYRIEKENTISIQQFIELLHSLEHLKRNYNINYKMELGGKTIEDIEKEINIPEEYIKEKLQVEEKEKVEGDAASAPASAPATEQEKKIGGKYHKLSKKKISNKRQKNMRINKRGKTMRNKQNKTLRKKSKISKKNKTHKNSRNNNSSKNSKKK